MRFGSGAGAGDRPGDHNLGKYPCFNPLFLVTTQADHHNMQGTNHSYPLHLVVQPMDFLPGGIGYSNT